MIFSVRGLLAPVLLVALLVPAPAVADQPMSMSTAVQKLTRQGADGIVEFVRRDHIYRAVVRRADGSRSLIAIDPATGRLSAVEDGDLLRNSLDTQFVTQWLRVFTDSAAPELRPAADVVGGLMATGKFTDLHALKLDGATYTVTMVDTAGQLVTLEIDGRTTSVAERSGV